MIFTRHCLALFVVGCCCTQLRAAEDAPATGSGSSDAGGSTSGSGTTGTTTPNTGASSSFGSSVFSSGTNAYNSGNPPLSGQDTGTATGTGAASAFSKPSGASNANSYVLPGFYGQGRQVLTTGQGVLARPRFETRFSLSMGYDDNYLSAPGGGAPSLSAPNGSFTIVPGVPAGTPIYKDEVVFIGGAKAVRKVLVGFTKVDQPGEIIPLFDTIPPAKRLGSLLTKATFGLDMQMAKPRSVFTLSASGGTTYYWDKDKDPFDKQASLNASFVYKLTPRLQATAQVSAAYSTQPDFSQVNQPNRTTRGPYITTNERGDLSYKFTPRFSMSGTVTGSSLRYTDSTEEVSNYDELTLGAEARYLWNPRYTFLTEFRHSMTGYSNNPVRDYTTDFFLIGTEFRYTSRLDGSLRIGESVLQYDQGGSASAPYLETSLNYRATSRSLLEWTNRFGFEEPDGPNQERLVFRTGLNYTYSFTPRLRGTLGVNLLRERNKVINGSSDATVRLTFDSTAVLEYTINQHFSVNLTYSLTDLASDRENESYYRNRIYLGGDYLF
jgi:hypothetical protein